MGNLSPDLTGPVALRLAKAVEQLPGEHGMPGGASFELKWDIATLPEAAAFQLPLRAGRVDAV